MAPLQLITLGSVRLTDANGRELEGPRRAELVLLAYLARLAPRAVSRETVASLFWAESDEAHARQSLRQALYRLRRHVGDALVVQRDHVQLVPGTVELDLQLLESRIEAGELAAAIADCAGDFLPWAEELGGEQWRSWLESERHSLRHRLLWALDRLTGQAEAAEDHPSAIRWAEQWAAMAPFESAPWIALVTGLERAGRSSEAQSRLELAIRRFEEDLGAVPDELHRLTQQLRRTREPQLAGSPIDSPAPATVISGVVQKLDQTGAVLIAEGDPASQAEILDSLVLASGMHGGEPLVLRLDHLRGSTGGARPVTQRLLASLAGAPGLGGASPEALAGAAGFAPEIRERFPGVESAPGAADHVILHEILDAVAREQRIVIVAGVASVSEPDASRLLLALAARIPAGVVLVLAGESAELEGSTLMDRLALLPATTHVRLSRAMRASPGSISRERAKPIRRSAWAAGLGLLFLTSGILVLRTRTVESESEAHSPRLVVVAFANQTGDPALNPVGRIAADWLTQGIARANIATVAPPLLTVRPPEEDTPDGMNRIRALGDEAQARLVLTGSYYLSGDSLRIQTTVTDLTRGQILGTTTSLPAPVSNPMPAIDDLLDRSLAALAPWLDFRMAGGAAVQSAPPSYESYRAFAHGLDLMYRSETRSVHEFLRAYQLDTTYTLPLLYAALTYTGMGDLTRVDSLVNQLQLRRSELAPYDRHVLDYLAALMRGDHAGKYAAAKQAARIAPRSLLDVVNLPGAALDINRPHEALALLGRINPENSAARGLRGYWLNLSMALHAVGDYQEQFELGRRVHRDMPEEPRALAYQVRGLAALGLMDRLETVLDAGLRLPPTTQWRNYGLYLHWVAFDELTAHGYGADAGVVLERGLRLTEEAWPADTPEPLPRFLRSICLLRLGHLAEARALLEQINQEAHPEPSQVAKWGHLGMVGALQNDAELADEADRRLAAIRIPPYIGYRGEHTMYRAAIQALLGNREAAVRLLHQAMREGYAITAEFHTTWAFRKLQGFRPYEEMLRPKG